MTGCSDNHCFGFVFLLFENRSVNVQIHPKRFAKKYSCLYFIRGHSKFTERRREEERGREGGNLFRSSVPFRRTDSFLIGVILQNLGRDKVV